MDTPMPNINPPMGEVKLLSLNNKDTIVILFLKMLFH